METEAFTPDWASAPGETIRDVLEERHVSVEDFAQRIGWSTSEIGKLLDGTVPIDRGLAKKLELTLGSSETFWLARERQYRQTLQRLGHGQQPCGRQ